jgi:hypothetical protein
MVQASILTYITLNFNLKSTQTQNTCCPIYGLAIISMVKLDSQHDLVSRAVSTCIHTDTFACKCRFDTGLPVCTFKLPFVAQ